jgi:methanogenic corrinoid protein MtbC1
MSSQQKQLSSQEGTMADKIVIAGALGECVHVAGVTNFLRLAEEAGWQTVFLGPAVSTEEVLTAAKQNGASLVGVSYRLTPETGERPARRVRRGRR